MLDQIGNKPLELSEFENSEDKSSSHSIKLSAKSIRLDPLPQWKIARDTVSEIGI